MPARAPLNFGGMGSFSAALLTPCSLLTWTWGMSLRLPGGVQGRPCCSQRSPHLGAQQLLPPCMHGPVELQQWRWQWQEELVRRPAALAVLARGASGAMPSSRAGACRAAILSRAERREGPTLPGDGQAAACCSRPRGRTWASSRPQALFEAGAQVASRPLLS